MMDSKTEETAKAEAQVEELTALTMRLFDKITDLKLEILQDLDKDQDNGSAFKLVSAVSAALTSAEMMGVILGKQTDPMMSNMLAVLIGMQIERQAWVAKYEAGEL